MNTIQELNTAHECNTFLSVRRRDKRAVDELIRHAASKGIILEEGKFYQFWEHNTITGEITPAKVTARGFISAQSIIKKVGCEYDKAWNLDAAEKIFKR